MPVRKPRKLPAECASISYDLEYGQDTLEIHRDAVGDGHRVIIADDLLATGGTARAVVDLVEQLGGVVVGLVFVVELEFHDPSGRLEITHSHARRLDTLNGKRIGLLSNEQWQAHRTLPMMQAILQADFPGVEVLPVDTFPQGEHGDRTALTHPLSLIVVAFVVTAIPAFLLTKIIR